VLEIAFSLSAVLYYIELQDFAKKRTKMVLLIHEHARSKATTKFGKSIIDELKDFSQRNRPTAGIFSLADAQPTDKFQNERNDLANRLLFFATSGFAIRCFASLTHVFVATSARDRLLAHRR
jgi:hypothetical protein